MGNVSAIEWTDATYNPWRGCDKVSPGCAHCYMFSEQRRYGRDPSVVTRCADSTFYAPVRSSKWRALKPGSLVFTCSWSDWFHELADPWRDEAWGVLRGRPDLTWQILTKRPELIADRLPADWGDGWPNVWLGVSIENRRFVERAEILRRIPAAVRFISAEPLLGPLFGVVPCMTCRKGPDAIGVLGSVAPWGSARGTGGAACPDCHGDGWRDSSLDLTDIDWLIVGGESGSGHRPMRMRWVHQLRRECQETGTAFFFKQLGGAHSGTRLDALPEGLRVRQLPQPNREESTVGRP